jgi:hypothetical protein
LNVSNAVFGVGNDGTISNGFGAGTVTVSNGTLNAETMVLGSTAGGAATVNVKSNGIINVDTDLTIVGAPLAGTNTLNITNGTLNAPNGLVSVGSIGNGRVTLGTGAVATVQSMKLGGTDTNSSGVLLILPGAHLTIVSNLSANQIVVGGDLDDNGTSIIIGENHDATLIVTNGTVRASIQAGYTSGYTGTYIQNGGTVIVTDTFIVGDCAGGAIGAPTVSGGVLYITNDTQTATLDVRNGTFVLNPGGVMQVDVLIVSTTCGHFVNNGGTITYNTLVLDPNLSAVGDGIPNSWKQANGFDPLSSSVAGADPDGDGASNYNEYMAGTDPNDANSVFKIVSVVRTNNNQNVRLDWNVVGGHSYVVQSAADANGGLGMPFTDISGLISVGGVGEGRTNYVHVGGAGSVGRYYRVRLGP